MPLPLHSKPRALRRLVDTVWPGRAVSMLLVALGVSAGVTSTSANAVEISYWEHNGSVMKMVQRRQKVTIRYDEPTKRVRRLGVRRGDIVFSGFSRRDGLLRGEAFVFRNGCEPAGYTVEGDWDPVNGKEVLVLQGDAPVRARRSCRVIDYSNARNSATLVFNLQGRDGHAGRTDDTEGQFDDEPYEPEPRQTTRNKPGFKCAPYLRSGQCPEATICRSEDLSYQDAMMGRLYKELLGLSRNGSQRDQFRADQREALADRASCGCNERCLEDWYRSHNKGLGKTTVILRQN
jgi:hypothetical protein